MVIFHSYVKLPEGISLETWKKHQNHVYWIDSKSVTQGLHLINQSLWSKDVNHGAKWVCLKIGYIHNYSHLIGIMISKTIGFRGLAYFQTHPNVSGSLQLTILRLVCVQIMALGHVATVFQLRWRFGQWQAVIFSCGNWAAGGICAFLCLSLWLLWNVWARIWRRLAKLMRCLSLANFLEACRKIHIENVTLR